MCCEADVFSSVMSTIPFLLSAWLWILLWLPSPAITKFTWRFIIMFLDIHECMETPNLCGPNSICTNNNGSYSCSCWSGYHVTNADYPISDKNLCIGKYIFYWRIKWSEIWWRLTLCLNRLLQWIIIELIKVYYYYCYYFYYAHLNSV